MEVVASRYGKLIASRNDVYIGRGLFEYGEFSESEVDLFRKLIDKNDIVVDVGANIGAHTLAFSRMARHVYAYEPIPMFYMALCGMVALNELKNVTTIHAGCAGREGTMSYTDVDLTHPNNFGASPLMPYDKDRPIRITRLTQDCNFLKIDVEGMELEVLKGGSDMIRRCKPIIYLECDHEEKFEPLKEYLNALGYIPHWHTPSLFNEKNFLGNPKDIWGDVSSFNLLCTREPIPNWPEATEFVPGFKRQEFPKFS